MANLEFCDTHNMVSYLLKTNKSEDTREVQINATIDGKVKLLYEEFIRRHLKLEDSVGISTLPNTEIFEQLALMGNIATAIIFLATNRTFNFSKMIFDGMLKNLDNEAASTGVDVRHGRAATTISGLDAGQGNGNIDKSPSMPYDSPLPRVNTFRSDEGSMTLNELTVLCIKLSQKVESLEADLKQAKKVYGDAYNKLFMKIKVKLLCKNLSLNLPLQSYSKDKKEMAMKQL
nr:hypothetical protein [Tanacetum cinerariifolium]